MFIFWIYIFSSSFPCPSSVHIYFHLTKFGCAPRFTLSTFCMAEVKPLSPLLMVFVCCSWESLRVLKLHNCAGWLEDAAYFAAIDDAMNTFSWYEWPEPLKHRHLAALEEIYQSKKEFVRSIDPLPLLILASLLFCSSSADRYIHRSAIFVPKAMAECPWLCSGERNKYNGRYAYLCRLS